MKKIKLGVVDSSGLLHRAKHSALKNNQDMFLLFLTYLQDIHKKLNCDRYVLCNDLTNSRYRKDLLEDYKEHRKELAEKRTPKEEEMAKLMSKLRRHLFLLSPYFIDGNVNGVEADDIMALLYNDKDLEEFEVIVISTDKDLLSAVPYYSIFNPMKMEFRLKKDLKGLNSKNQFLMMQSFLGDTQDFKLKLTGIGESTAVKLASNFANFKELKEFLNDKSNWENEKNSYLKKAYSLLATKEGWETLGTIFKLVQIFRDTSNLNEQELLDYNNVKERILNYESVDFVVSEELDNFCLENNFDIDIYDLLEEIVSDFR